MGVCVLYMYIYRKECVRRWEAKANLLTELQAWKRNNIKMERAYCMRKAEYEEIVARLRIGYCST